MSRVLVFASLAAALVGCSGTVGGKTRDALRTGITDRQADLRQCYQEALVRDREAAGEVHVVVTVKSDQKNVDQVDFGDSAIQDAEMQGCVQRAISGVSIQEAPTGNVRANFTLSFSPEEGAAVAPAEGAPPAEGAAPAEGGQAAATE